MKKYGKVGKTLVMCLSVLLMFSLFKSNAKAIQSVSRSVITPAKMQEWDNGAKITTDSGGSGSDYKTDIEADTSGLAKGYYTVYLYDVKTRRIASYDGICFSFKNKNNSEMKINLSLTVDSKTSVTMTDSSYAILESDDQKFRNVTVPTYGTISIPANFNGTVYVPFSKLYSSDGKKIPLNQIQSWGITAVMSQDQKLNYQIGNIALLSGSIASMKNSYYLITISGNNKITIPNAGSIMETYQVKLKDLDGNPVDQTAAFFLNPSVTGVKITDDGKLEVGDNCADTNIMVCAKLKDSSNYGELNVSLRHAGAALVSTSIPKTSSVPKLTTTFETKLNQLTNLVRLLSIVMVIIFCCIFYSWFTESNTNYMQIRKRLYQSTDHEEEEKT